MTPLYLDHNATAPPLPQAWDAVRAAVGDAFGNAASGHHAGRRARRALQDAREAVARRLDCRPDEVLFTSGATEANNLALFGLAGDPPGHVLASAVEHPCVAEPLARLAARGFDVELLPVDGYGRLDPDDVGRRVRPDTRLVAVMLANHETGAVQPVADIARGLSPGVAVHTDAAQAVGKVAVGFRPLGVASLSLSAHKFRGPQGVGALVVRHDAKLRPLFFGGHQQGGRRPGTEPVALAVGLAVAIEHACDRLAEFAVETARLRDAFLRQLESGLGPNGFAVNGPPPGDAGGLPSTLNLSFPGCRSDVLLMSLDLAGVACSAGAACASGSTLPSPVLRAMGLPDERVRSALRFSFGPPLTVDAMTDAARRVAACVRRVRSPA